MLIMCPFYFSQLVDRIIALAQDSFTELDTFSKECRIYYLQYVVRTILYGWCIIDVGFNKMSQSEIKFFSPICGLSFDFLHWSIIIYR